MTPNSVVPLLLLLLPQQPLTALGAWGE